MPGWRRDACAIYFGVPRSWRFRLLALVVALLGSLSAPSLAIAHGRVHEHVAHRHGADEFSHVDPSRAADRVADDHGVAHGDESADARDATASGASVRQAPAGEHAHGHPRVDAVQGVRDLTRLPATHEYATLVPAVVTIRATRHVVQAPARTDRVLLARPDPERGPPPTLRAPPTS